jgi:uncharacterized protein with NAD-binding domain and iron-sulfur cluster
MVKIVIIGGGISGLSAATFLCDNPNINVEIYEKENELGGQASSMYNDNCNIEHSWRVFGRSYHNIWYIFNNILHICDNFTTLKKNCLITNDVISNGSPDAVNLLSQILNTTKFQNYYKLFDFLFLCKNRVVDSYDNVNAFEYFDKNDVIKSILGPMQGLEAIKLSISSTFKNMYQIMDTKEYSFSPNGTQITNMPTNDAVFNYWEKYLLRKNIRIHKSHSLQDIYIENNEIKYVVINSQKIYADEFIFACSLKPLNKILENKYNCPTFQNMKKLEQNLQLYFTINMYFNKKLNMTCDNIILLKESWQPIIQRKIFWPQKIIDNCKLNKSQVKEIWNVGFLDYQKGSNNKILRDCSLEEAVNEGLLQIKENKYILNIMKENGVSFNEVYLGYDIWHQFKNGSENFPANYMNVSNQPKLSDLNPKFSVNEGTMQYMPESQPTDIPRNMYLSGYYVNSTYGGASMEASCETGLVCAKTVLDKYNVKNDTILPIKHTNDRLLNSLLLLPFIKLDEILYNNGLPPITNYINSFYLLLSIVVLFMIFIFYALLFAYRNYNKLKQLKMNIPKMYRKYVYK